jgi:hypothetical protein
MVASNVGGVNCLVLLVIYIIKTKPMGHLRVPLKMRYCRGAQKLVAKKSLFLEAPFNA